MKGLASVFLATLLLTGCALTRPVTTISVERQQFINAYARARVLYQRLAARVEADCLAGTLSQEAGVNAAAIDREAKALDSEIRAKIDTPESEVDWSRVMRILELALSLIP